jgi:hypothetical protein
MLESKYLEFKLLEQKPKTKVYEILSKLHGFRLGIIKWYGAWRQYCFFPERDTIFNTQCMQDIMNFIINLKNEN